MKGAIAAYKQAIKLQPKFATAQTNLSVVYVNQKKYPAAIACARAAIAADPKYAKGHAILGLALRESGDISSSRFAIAEAARLDKQFAPWLAKLSEELPRPREIPNPR